MSVYAFFFYMKPPNKPTITTKLQLAAKATGQQKQLPTQNVDKKKRVTSTKL